MERFSVMYCSQKKVKSWKDGEVRYVLANSKATLYDEFNNKLDTLFVPSDKRSSMREGEELEFDKFYVQIEAMLPAQEPSLPEIHPVQPAPVAQGRAQLHTTSAVDGHRGKPKLRMASLKPVGLSRPAKNSVEMHTPASDLHPLPSENDPAKAQRIQDPNGRAVELASDAETLPATPKAPRTTTELLALFSGPKTRPRRPGATHSSGSKVADCAEVSWVPNARQAAWVDVASAPASASSKLPKESRFESTNVGDAFPESGTRETSTAYKPSIKRDASPEYGTRERSTVYKPAFKRARLEDDSPVPENVVLGRKSDSSVSEGQPNKIAKWVKIFAAEHEKSKWVDI
ncbi:hypothetical protein HK104_000802 [Borealophlyctis nickersoniae]|nr:hypothetical protein HK104_000802 [Borealophlyctis nickersoniae]